MSKKTKSKTTSAEQTSMTQAPTNPAWVESGLAGIGGQVSDLSKLDPYSLVAGPDALQTQAAQGAAGLNSPQGFADASTMLKGLAGQGANTYNPTTGHASQAQSASLLDGLQGYMSPYRDDVVNTALADYDYGAGQAKAQSNLDMANGGAFGGSGGALGVSMTNDALTRGRGTLSAGLRNDMFNTGANLSNMDAGRRQEVSLANANANNQFGLANMNAQNSAGQFNAGQRDAAINRDAGLAGQLAGIAGAQGVDARANIGTQADMGGILQQLAQSRAMAPLSLLGTQASLMSGLPLSLLRGQTANGTSNSQGTSQTTVSDPMGAIGGLMAGAGSLASGLGAMGVAFPSDERLKRDEVKIGERPDGLGVWLYRYLWSPMWFIGVMAQEALKVKPEAVLTMPNGYLAVDYGKL